MGSTLLGGDEARAGETRRVSRRAYLDSPPRVGMHSEEPPKQILLRSVQLLLRSEGGPRAFRILCRLWPQEGSLGFGHALMPVASAHPQEEVLQGEAVQVHRCQVSFVPTLLHVLISLLFERGLKKQNSGIEITRNS